MADYVITSCSTADLSREHFDEIGVKVIYFHYYLDGVEYADDLWQTRSDKEFYDAMRNGSDTSSAQVSVGEYLEFFRPILKEGHDILHVTLSSGISGTYNSAVSAASIAESEFPGRRVIVVDSQAASSGFGMLLDRAAELKREGYSIDELRDWLEANKHYLHHWFFTTDLRWFIKGGRVSKVTGVVGGLLSICPLLHVSYDGRLEPVYNVRTKRKVIDKMVNVMVENARGGTDYDDKCYLCHSDSIEDVNAVIALVKSKFPKLTDDKFCVNSIGTTIGSHTGPGTVAIFFWSDKER